MPKNESYIKARQAASTQAWTDLGYHYTSDIIRRIIYIASHLCRLLASLPVRVTGYGTCLGNFRSFETREVESPEFFPEARATSTLVN